MKKLLTISSFLLFTTLGFGQTATVTATIQDPTTQVFANGTVTITFVPNPSSAGPYTVSGSLIQLNGANYGGALTLPLDGTGTFTTTMSRNDFIQPAGSKWQFVVCPNAASGCTTSSLVIASASPNISSLINASVSTISVFAGQGIPRAYANSELVLTPNAGQVYWNVTSNTLNFWNGSSWLQALLSGSTPTFTSLTVTAASTFNGLATFTAGLNSTTGVFSSSLTALSYNNKQMCDQFAGADVGAKINACIAATPIGGSADATGITSGTCTTNVNINRTITLLLGPPISGSCNLQISARNISIIGWGGQGDFSFDTNITGTTWTYTGTTGDHVIPCNTASGCASGLFIQNMTFVGNPAGTSGHGFSSKMGGAGASLSSVTLVNVHFTSYPQDGIHLEDNNFNFNWYKVSAFLNKGHALLAGPNASSFSIGQFRCYGCIFEKNTGTDAGYGTIPSSNKLAQVRITGSAEYQFIGGTIADTPTTNANGIGFEIGQNAATCASPTGPIGRISGVHFESLGIGVSGATDTLNNSIYFNACLGGLQIDNNNFVGNGNVRNAIVTDANSQGATIVIGPNNSYGGYTKGYDGSLETGNSVGSVWILDDSGKLPSSAIVQNVGNLGSFYWMGAQFTKTLVRFSNAELNINGGALTDIIRMDTTVAGAHCKFIANDGNNLIFENCAQNSNTFMDDNGNWIFPAGVSIPSVSNNKGIQAFNTTTTCTTAASVGATCTTGAITLPVAYADTNYRLSCTGLTTTAVPVVQTVSKSNTTFTITIVAVTAVAASFGSYDCIAVHN